MSKNVQGQKFNYEKQVKRVDEIIAQLREGKGTLEDALKQYEEGVSTVQSCLSAIDAMEKRIVEISENPQGGEPSETPFV